MNNSNLEEKPNVMNVMEHLDYLQKKDPNRRLKIIDCMLTMDEEHTKKNISAIAAGICFSGAMVATYFSGIDASQAFQNEIQSLNYIELLKDFTPAMWTGMITTVISLSQYMKHSIKQTLANREFYELWDNRPESFKDNKSEGKSR